MKYGLPFLIFFFTACNNVEKKFPFPAFPKKDSLIKATGEIVTAGNENIEPYKPEKLAKRSKAKMKKKTHLTLQQDALDSALISNQ